MRTVLKTLLVGVTTGVVVGFLLPAERRKRLARSLENVVEEIVQCVPDG